ncbi:MAG: tetraacyldisaccharide 4'-kinase [bacterium]
MSFPVHDARGVRRLPGDAAPGLSRSVTSWLYGLGVRAAALPWELSLRTPQRAERPVVSVGALTAGGAGKTPVVRWLAARLAERGLLPAILSRGYRSDGGEAPRIVDSAAPDGRRDGDEPALLARVLPDVPVVVCPDRSRGAAVATSRGANVLLLDDGFQHRRLHRDFDLVLWDRRSEAAHGKLLPAGPLREPPSALRRADAVLLVDRGDGPPERPSDVSRAWVARLVTGARASVQAGTTVHALSGIADPEGFERSLSRLGLHVTGATRFPDHHAFTTDEVRAAAARASAEGADLVGVTAKDWMRWPRERSGLPVPCVFDLDVEVEDGELLLETIVSVIAGEER